MSTGKVADAGLRETRVSGTADLMMLYVSAKRREVWFNLPDDVASDLDPDGNHVFTLLYAVSSSRSTDETARTYLVQVLVKRRNSKLPFCGTMELDADHWVSMYTLDEAREMMGESGGFRLSPRLTEKLATNETSTTPVKVNIVS